MGFLKRFFRNVLHEGMPTPRTSSFEHLTEEELEAHLGVGRYGGFMLTDAVRPSYDLQVIPQQGFRQDVYRDEETNAEVPVLMVSASSGVLYELFLDLLEPLGQPHEVGDVTLGVVGYQAERLAVVFCCRALGRGEEERRAGVPRRLVSVDPCLEIGPDLLR